jgi:hypothetical protein
MSQAVIKSSKELLPIGTALLSNLALSLFMWNIALRVALLLVRGVSTLSL